jgi:hypothetical protein
MVKPYSPPGKPARPALRRFSEGGSNLWSAKPNQVEGLVRSRRVPLPAPTSKKRTVRRVHKYLRIYLNTLFSLRSLFTPALLPGPTFWQGQPSAKPDPLPGPTSENRIVRVVHKHLCIYLYTPSFLHSFFTRRPLPFVPTGHGSPAAGHALGDYAPNKKSTTHPQRPAFQLPPQ